MPTLPSLEAYQAALILSTVGDALGSGCKIGRSPSGAEVQQSLSSAGGVDSIEVRQPQWPVSQNTVLHLVTAEALATGRTSETLWPELASRYVDSMSASMMADRRPSTSILRATALLRPAEPQGWEQPFDESRAAVEACPAARSMCIGLRFHKPSQLYSLISTAVEGARITHHHPTAYMGAVASALFTSYAIQRREVREWGAGLLEVIPEVLGYVVSTGRDVDANQRAWCYFGDVWREYVSLRGIMDGESEPKFPRRYGVEKRDETYRRFATPDMIPGSCGHDAPLIAYDALLCSRSWRELCDRAIFHCGDGSSSGAIAASWWGLIHGLGGVPASHHKKVEFRDRLKDAGTKLFAMSF